MVRNLTHSVLLASLLLTAGTTLFPAAAPTAIFAAEGAHDAKSVSLGVIKIGDYEVEPFQEGKVEAGKEATFQFVVKGEPAPVAIRIWIGIESGRGSAKGKAHKHGDTTEAHCDVPSPLPEGSKLWIEIETAGGKVKASVDYKRD